DDRPRAPEAGGDRPHPLARERAGHLDPRGRAPPVDRGPGGGSDPAGGSDGGDPAGRPPPRGGARGHRRHRRLQPHPSGLAGRHGHLLPPEVAPRTAIRAWKSAVPYPLFARPTPSMSLESVTLDRLINDLGSVRAASFAAHASGSARAAIDQAINEATQALVDTLN